MNRRLLLSLSCIVLSGGHVYSWDAENRIVAAYSNNVCIASNADGHMSRRVTKKVYALSGYTPPYGEPPMPGDPGEWGLVREHTYFYDGWNLVLETVAHADGSVDRIEYVWGLDISGKLQGAGGVGGLLFEVRNGQIFIPFYDANGNVTAYVDAHGNVRGQYIYDVFGNTVVQSGDLADTFKFRFSTKYWDEETRSYYYGYRHYAPKLECWLSRDPIGVNGGLNEYGFVNNDPVNRWDRLGLISIAPVDDSPRVATVPSGETMYIWASAFVLFDELDKQAIADAGGGILVHGKRVSVNLRKCDSGETIKESQALSKRLFLSSNTISSYRTTQPSKDGNDYIYFNLLHKKVPDNCVKGTIEVMANWHLYPKGDGSPALGAVVDDNVSGSLDGQPSHGNVSAHEGWPNVRKHRGFSSGWFNFTIRIFCNGNWKISASAVPLYPKPIGRVSPNNGSGRVTGIGHDEWPWMQ